MNTSALFIESDITVLPCTHQYIEHCLYKPSQYENENGV